MFIGWISKTKESLQKDKPQDFQENVVERCIELAMKALFLPSEYSSIGEKSAQYLLFYSNVAAQDLLEIRCMPWFLDSVHSLAQSSEEITRSLIYQFVTNVFTCFPIISMTSTEVIASRAMSYDKLINPLLIPFNALIENNDMSTSNIQYLMYAIGIIESSCKTLQNASQNAKLIIYPSFQNVISNYNIILPRCVENEGTFWLNVKLYSSVCSIYTFSFILFSPNNLLQMCM